MVVEIDHFDQDHKSNGARNEGQDDRGLGPRRGCGHGLGRGYHDRNHNRNRDDGIPSGRGEQKRGIMGLDI